MRIFIAQPLIFSAFLVPVHATSATSDSLPIFNPTKLQQESEVASGEWTAFDPANENDPVLSGLRERMMEEESTDSILLLDADGRWSAIALTVLLNKLLSLCPNLFQRHVGAVLGKGSGLIVADLIARGVPMRHIFRELVRADTTQGVGVLARFLDVIRNLLLGMIETATGNSSDYEFGRYTTSVLIDTIAPNVHKSIARPGRPRPPQDFSIFPIFPIDDKSAEDYGRRKRVETFEEMRQLPLIPLKLAFMGEKGNAAPKVDRTTTASVWNLVRESGKKLPLEKDVVFVRFQAKLDNKCNEKVIVSYKAEKRTTDNGYLILLMSFRFALGSQFALWEPNLAGARMVLDAMQRLRCPIECLASLLNLRRFVPS